MSRFSRATKLEARLRLALVGPGGSGKTYSALAIAQGLGKRIALIDTEHKSASKYADEFEFQTCALDSFEPQNYIDAMKDAEREGFDVLVIDSLSHAWSGKGGALDQVDKAAKRSKSANTHFAWRDVTPQHNALVEAMLSCGAHLIVTMRTKTEYVIELVDGKNVPRKVGLAPIQRDGLEYEFDLMGEMTYDHEMVVGKTRVRSRTDDGRWVGTFDNITLKCPGRAVGEQLLAWTRGAKAPFWARSGALKGRDLRTVEPLELSDHMTEINELLQTLQGASKQNAERYLAECQALFREMHDDTPPGEAT